MKIEIPTEIRKFAFRELTLIEPNDTDVERMLTQIFEMAIKSGRTASNNDADKQFSEKFEELIKSDSIEGFDDPKGRAVLEGWLRASVVKMGRKGLRRDSEKMQFFRPRTIAVFRAGFPSRSRHRGADTLVYNELVREVASRNSSKDAFNIAKQSVQKMFMDSFGTGVEFSPAPVWEPKFNQKAELDISALLSLLFLETFEARSGKVPKEEIPDSPIPGATSPLGADVIDYLQSYGDKAPAMVVSEHLAALIGLRLFQLPLRNALAVRRMIVHGELAEDMTNSGAENQLKQYVDFTGKSGSASDRLAKACVQRDMALTRQFFWDRVFLLQLSTAPDLRKSFADASVPPAERLLNLVKSQDEPKVISHLELLLSMVIQENEETDDQETAEFLAMIDRDSRHISHRLTDVMVEGLKPQRGYENANKWFWSTGGIKTDVGLLAGNLNSRASWTYAPSDKLLASLLAVTFTRKGGGEPLLEMRLEDVLRKFRDYFGLLIDQPPDAEGFNTAENRAAAAENFEAFKIRLKLLGVFDGLSDDLSAQRVRNPLRNILEAK